jgi:non-canonical poly(A) RNA polymerase PAPD5/7
LLICANRLHKEICDFYEFVRPQKFEQTAREELLDRLQIAVKNHLPQCNIHCFGSFAAGLYLPNADMDLVIISDQYRNLGQKLACQTNGQMRKFGRYLHDAKVAKAGSVEVIVGAKVPIVKFVDRITSIKVDVSFENDTGLIANETFSAWKKQYPAMPTLVTLIKQFLMMRGLNEVMNGGLGGFSVTCLVTSMLQNMPRVQAGELIPEKHLGEMLIEFLDLYGNRLDITRTGIMMNPPGYFNKVRAGL